MSNNEYNPRFKGFNNQYKICGNYTIIYLKHKSGIIQECLIDTDDLEYLKEINFSWYLRRSKFGKTSPTVCYACSTYYYRDENGRRKQKTLYLHNIILRKETNKDIHINHINHDRLDNRKNNLEVVPCSINSQLREGANSNNKTGIRNVCWLEKPRQYWVQIMKDGIRYKWEFSENQFEEACKFAEEKRNEIYGKV